MCLYARERALAWVVDVTAIAPRFPINALVARFIDRLTGLSPSEWESIQRAMSTGGTEVQMLEASRNAAVAIAVRDLISREQFEILYAPFLMTIPIESLELPPTLD
jgi:hypothetical protein